MQFAPNLDVQSHICARPYDYVDGSVHEISVLIASVGSKDSCDFAHMRRLA